VGVLLDIGMPKMNGYDVCPRIRSFPWSEKVLILALTGWGQDKDPVNLPAPGSIVIWSSQSISPS
jgi:CheY-like chemotaxis protein